MSSTAKKKNPRKYKDRIALQKQAEDAKNEEFEAIMRDLSSAKELRNSNCMLQDSNGDEGSSSLLSPNTLGPHRIRRVSDSRSNPYERSRSLSPRPSSLNNKSVILTPRDYGNLLQPPVAAAHLTRQRSDPYLARLSPPTTSNATSSAYSSGSGLTTTTYTHCSTSQTNLNGLDNYVNNQQQVILPYNGNHQDYTSADLQLQQVYVSANNQNDPSGQQVYVSVNNQKDPTGNHQDYASADLQVQQVYVSANNQNDPTGQQVYVTSNNLNAPTDDQVFVSASNQNAPNSEQVYVSVNNQGTPNGEQVYVTENNQNDPTGQQVYVTSNDQQTHTGQQMNTSAGNQDFVPCPTLFTSSGNYSGSQAMQSQEIRTNNSNQNISSLYSGGGFDNAVLTKAADVSYNSQPSSPPYPTVGMPNSSSGGFNSKILENTAGMQNYSHQGSPVYQSNVIPDVSQPGTTLYQTAIMANSSQMGSPPYPTAEMQNCSEPGSPAYQSAALSNTSNPNSPAYQEANYSQQNSPPYLPTVMSTSNQSGSLPYPAANMPLSTQPGSTAPINSSMPPVTYNSPQLDAPAYLTSNNQNLKQPGGKIHQHGAKLLYPQNSDLSTIDINELLINDKTHASTPGELIDCDILSKALKTTFEPMNSNPTAHRVQSPSRRHTSANLNGHDTGNLTVAQLIAQQRRHSEGTPLITITSCDDDDSMAAENNFSMYRPDRTDSLSDYEDEMSRDSSSMPASPAGSFANLEDDNTSMVMSDDLKGIQLTDLNSGRVVLPDTVTGGQTDLDKLFEASFSKFQ